MNYTLDIMPTFAEDGSVITVIISSPEKKPISEDELADALYEYAHYLVDKEPETKN